MKKVGIDGHMIGDRSGGNESYYTNIILNMEFPKDIAPILFLKKGIDSSIFEDKFQVVRFESGNAFIRNFIEFPGLCRRYGLSLLHTQYFIPFFRRCPVMCTIHDICFEHYKDIFTKKEYLRQKLLIPYAARHSVKIFTVSENAKQDIMEHYGISEDKIVVTYNAVNEQFHKQTPEELNETELREKFGLGSGRVLLCVGNLQPRKNLPRLIRAFRAYKKSALDTTKLVIVGKKAWMFQDIMKEALGGDYDDIVFTDYVNTNDLVRLYNAADAFIYPSFFEGFGIPPLEAMACGTPVTVAKATSLPEVVGEAGQYFDPFDEADIERAIRTVLTAPVCDENIISRQVAKFSWKDSAKKIVNEYVDVLNNEK